MTGLKIQIVDDDVDFAGGVADILSAEGHDTTLAENGEQALAQKKQQLFDLTLMDIRMPGLGGVETFKRYKSIDPDSNVVMMSAFSLEDLDRQDVNQGLPPILAKPLDIDKLLSLIDRYASGIVVLLFNSDENFVTPVFEHLQADGHAVETARSGAELIRNIETNGARAIVLDVRSTSNLTLDVFRLIADEFDSLPAITLAEFLESEPKAMDAYHEIQARSVVIKPPDSDQLLNIVRRLAGDS